jgi:chemotaxis-related protein WspB
MLLLVFRLGDDRFAVDAGRILEVLPLVGVKRMLGAPAGISGTFNYHGRFVPVVDVSARLLGRPAEQRLSTRVVLVSVPAEGGPILLGLILENATETRRCLPADMIAPALVSREHPWLGPILFDARGAIQLIELDELVAEDMRGSLAAPAAEVA